jgi:hypothetical protein
MSLSVTLIREDFQPYCDMNGGFAHSKMKRDLGKKYGAAVVSNPLSGER